MCKCGEELVKGEGNVCVTEEERNRQKNAIKEEKLKKMKKKKKKIKKGNSQEEKEEVEVRVHYPWYYTVAPLMVTFLICKYWRPNLVTASGTILFIVISACLGPSSPPAAP